MSTTTESVVLKQCRFCLEFGEVGFVAPCACSGSAKYVHELCLARWRNESQRGRKVCGVCGTTWTIPAPPRIREFFVRTVRTAGRYQTGPPIENEGEVRSLIGTGSVIAQTSERALQFDQQLRESWTAPHLQAWSHQQQQQDQQQVRPQLRRRRRRMAFVDRENGGESNNSIRNLVAAVVRARSLQHWHRSVFVILYVGRGAASDGSDSVIACNLTRPMRSFSDDDGAVDGRRHDDSEAAEQDTGSRRGRRLSWLRSTIRLLRNPHSDSSSSSSSDEDLERESWREMRRAARAVRDLRGLGIDVKHFRGGPVDRDKPLGLIILREPEIARGGARPDAPAVAGVDVEPWTCADLPDSYRAFVGSVPDLAQCARLYSARGWSGTALCFAGIAVWSSDQLVAEIARRSWTLSRGSTQNILSETGHSLWNILLRGEATRNPEASSSVPDRFDSYHPYFDFLHTLTSQQQQQHDRISTHLPADEDRPATTSLDENQQSASL